MCDPWTIKLKAFLQIVKKKVSHEVSAYVVTAEWFRDFMNNLNIHNRTDNGYWYIKPLDQHSETQKELFLEKKGKFISTNRHKLCF